MNELEWSPDMECAAQIEAAMVSTLRVIDAVVAAEWSEQRRLGACDARGVVFAIALQVAAPGGPLATYRDMIAGRVRE